MSEPMNPAYALRELAIAAGHEVNEGMIERLAALCAEPVHASVCLYDLPSPRAYVASGPLLPRIEG